MTSAGVGSESLLHASRLALVDYIENNQSRSSSVCIHLSELLEQHLSNDRLATPTLEVVAYLLDAGAFQGLDDGLIK